MKRLLGKLYVQVVIAVIAGALLGVFHPDFATSLKPIGDAFIKLIKMLLAPVIFLTVVTGIAKMNDMKELGRVGIRAFIYFEVVSTLALIVGLLVVDTFKPGAGMNIDPATLDSSSIASYTEAAKHESFIAFMMQIIPIPSGTPSPRATSCRSCCSPSCSGWRWRAVVKRASRSSAPSTA